MNGPEAFTLSLFTGVWVTHPLFDKHEWVKLVELDTLETEDGYRIDVDTFIKDRQGNLAWLEDWCVHPNSPQPTAQPGVAGKILAQMNAMHAAKRIINS